MSLEKLRANTPLSHLDIKFIESELKAIVATTYPGGDPKTTVDLMLKHLMQNPTDSIDLAYESVTDPKESNRDRMYDPRRRRQ